MKKTWFDRHYRLMWWVASLLTPVLMGGLALVQLASGAVIPALLCVVFMCASVIWIHTNIQTFQRGYRRGMDAMVYHLSDAVEHGKSREEFLALTLDAPEPKPWE